MAAHVIGSLFFACRASVSIPSHDLTVPNLTVRDAANLLERPTWASHRFDLDAGAQNLDNRGKLTCRKRSSRAWEVARGQSSDPHDFYLPDLLQGRRSAARCSVRGRFVPRHRGCARIRGRFCYAGALYACLRGTAGAVTPEPAQDVIPLLGCASRERSARCDGTSTALPRQRLGRY